MRIYSSKSKTIADGSSVPDTWPQLMELISKATYNNEEDCNIHVWRGQADIRWRLDSAAYRRIRSSVNKSDLINEERLTTYENELLAAATHKGYRYVDGQQLSDVELLARLQHHGAATRLVDV